MSLGGRDSPKDNLEASQRPHPCPLFQGLKNCVQGTQREEFRGHLSHCAQWEILVLETREVCFLCRGSGWGVLYFSDLCDFCWLDFQVVVQEPMCLPSINHSNLRAAQLSSPDAARRGAWAWG